jgi:hypothetical protein
MGASNSYLKIKLTESGFGIGFVFEYKNEYKKIFMCAGHPDNTYKEINSSNKDCYEKYGDWYVYNGDFDELNNVLDKFDPKKSIISSLMDELQLRCEIQKYRTTWEIINQWTENVIKATKLIVDSASGWMGTGLLGMITYYLLTPKPNNDQVHQITHFSSSSNKCNICNGKGYNNVIGREACNKCAGLGRDPKSTLWAYPCRYCNGSGFMNVTRSICTRCNGKGTL